MRKRILLIGASGKIGSCIAYWLARNSMIKLISAYCQNTLDSSIRYSFGDPPEKSLPDPDSISIIIFAAHIENKFNAKFVKEKFAELVSYYSNRYFVYISSDAVFDGRQGDYNETDPVNPKSVYGENLAVCEQIIAANPRACIVRPSYLYGYSPAFPYPSRFTDAIKHAQANKPYPCFTNIFKSPIDFTTASSAIVRIVLHQLSGIFHIAGERTSIYDFTKRGLSVLGHPTNFVIRQTHINRPDNFLPLDTSLKASRIKKVLGFRFAPLEYSIKNKLLPD